MVTVTVELSARERSVLDGILRSLTYEAIAHELRISHETVKIYAKRLRAKTGATSKVGLALWGAKHLQG